MEVTSTPASGPECRIRVLPSALANQIAAGEVVARPASAIKELCENALDAGATSLEVEVDGGGITRLSVIDDGSGMTREEALLALERHATSKIATADDLFAISTMGFRGEALPSIASVSRFTLITRRRDDVAGTQVDVEAGAPPKVRDAGCAAGTRVEVRDLFFNTPARRKFLKAEATERGHAVEAVTRLALSRPDVSFRVRADGREVFSAPKTATLKGRAAQVFGRKVAEEIYPFNEVAFGLSIEGLLGHPGLARAGTKAISIFVNKRYVTDRAIAQALASAYGGLLDKGKYPLAVVWLEIDPSKIDVNVHPAKEEIRFSDPPKIFAAVRRAAIEGLRRTPWLGSEFYALPKRKATEVPDFGEPFSEPEKPAKPVTPELSLAPKAPNDDIFGAPMPAPAPPSSLPLPSAEEAALLFTGTPADLAPPTAAPASPSPLPVNREGGEATRQEALSPAAPQPLLPRAVGEGSEPAKRSEGGEGPDLGGAATTLMAAMLAGFGRVEETAAGRGASPEPAAAPLPAPLPERPKRPSYFAVMRPVGQIKMTYLILESTSGLVVIDQHAAHERVTYERLKAAYQDRKVPRQKLLFPATVELSAFEAAACESFTDELAALGLEVEPFGPQTIAVITVPLLLAKGNPESLLKSALDELARAETKVSLDDRMDHLLATMACHGSVRAGQVLSMEEIRTLLSQMDDTPNCGHCPHGRPVYVEHTWKELEKRFGRIQ